MIPAGYMYKNIVAKPDWIEAKNVVDILSVSHCVSDDFADYINFWQHNGYWLFDSPTIIEKIAKNNAIDLSKATVFYYEVYEYEFEENTKHWLTFAPEDFVTIVEQPNDKELIGYDVVTFFAHSSPECSPLSCNSVATNLAVNAHCLLDSFIEAKNALENGLFNNSEPGPFRIFAVYKVK